MKEKITGAEAMCRALLAEGVDTFFGYPGGQIATFYDKLYDYTDRLHHILARHEQGAIHAAQGYARATDKVGVVTVTSGPGSTNLITGICDAAVDSTPLVVITGQVGVNSLGTDAFQETDVVGITLPIAKWVCQVRRPEEIPAAMARAFYIARSGRPGPVVLDVTRDAQVGLVEWDYTTVNFIRSYNPDPELVPTNIETAARMINEAKKPLIISGHGVMLSGAEESIQALAIKADIPVACTLLGLSTMPSESPLYIGMVGMHGNIAANVATQEADLILAVGMRFDDRVIGVVSKYAPNARIIHIDIDTAEHNKTVDVEIAIHADARKALDAIYPLVEPATHSEWLKRLESPLKVEEEKVMKRELDPDDLGNSDHLRMGEVIRKVSEAAGNNEVVVTDVGQNQMMAVRYSKFKNPRSLISSGGLGTMGFSLPAAMGAKLGVPNRTVVAYMGDGGFQMTLQELGTIMEYRIGVKIVILNNNFLGNVRQWQALFYNDRFSATPLLNPDFVMLAQAYGIQAENVATRADLPGAIERMLADNNPYLLNVNIETEDMVFPMVPPGASIDEILLNATERYLNEE